MMVLIITAANKNNIAVPDYMSCFKKKLTHPPTKMQSIIII